MPTESNRQWVLSNRPTGEPTLSNFELVEEPVPEPGPKEVLVRTSVLSVDPYMRGRMRDSESYADPWPVGEPMRARSVGTVVESNHAAFEAGDTVTGNLYWAEYAAVDGADLEAVDAGSAPDSTALHALGMPGRTAYVGTVDVGRVEPGDTVVVSAAAGAVGSVAGQIARIAGCRVVGITGRAAKVDWLTDDLGFDAAINYRTADDLSDAVAEVCPTGVDLYFENVGGEISDAVTDHLVDHSRVAVCGKIALYNQEDGDDELVGPRRLHQRTRTRVEGFIVSDHADRFDHVDARLRRWVEDEAIRYRETVTDGIENTPEAFLGLFEGTNLGKQLVRLEDGE
ncbi:NADP-dependent oxidoreductase [Salinadaptatus halalkaliphilus]|uniref:NADP-dependent oxidoreductase n=1 Tax=Salinadaptatus halalkaliphilus TaxID=2419781 RepID=A0A4S3TQZ7_9EURY|nr:NADP-dependent oxidoreductase [Salinadaptatus halalkaliphilus]THE66832.1 NADP-dependent oxidoreductase [Salinadaptatus halalkaliphilus]